MSFTLVNLTGLKYEETSHCRSQGKTKVRLLWSRASLESDVALLYNVAELVSVTADVDNLYAVNS